MAHIESSHIMIPLTGVLGDIYGVGTGERNGKEHGK